jgi:hypothetical protein
MEGLWLVQEDGGEGERVLLDVLVGWEQRGEAAAAYLSWPKILHGSSSSSSFPNTRGQKKGERAATVGFRPEGGGGSAGVVRVRAG